MAVSTATSSGCEIIRLAGFRHPVGEVDTQDVARFGDRVAHRVGAIGEPLDFSVDRGPFGGRDQSGDHEITLIDVATSPALSFACHGGDATAAGRAWASTDEGQHGPRGRPCRRRIVGMDDDPGADQALDEPSNSASNSGAADGQPDDASTSSHGHGHHHHAEHAMVHKHRDVQGGAARAAVFGVSDGLVSNVALILGVAAASVEASTVVVAGVSGLLAGAASMAAGEYVSVKAQAELIERELEIERESIAEKPRLETRELAAIYASRGIDRDHAEAMADAVMADPEVALEVHAREELGIDPDAVADARVAAVSSFGAFAVGAVLPLVPWFFAAGTAAVVASVIVGLIAACSVGWLLAVFTERSKVKTMARQAGLATAACALTWAIGSLLGATVI